MPSLRLRLSFALLAAVAALVFVTRETPTPQGAARSSTHARAPQIAQATQTAAPTVGSTKTAAESTSAADASASTPEHVRANAIARAAAFTDWLTAWRRTDAAGQAAIANHGHELAAARRAALKELIPLDPALALDLALPAGLRAELPATIQAHLEQRIDQRGNFEAAIACYGPITRITRTVEIGGVWAEAHVYGRRTQQGTKFGLPLHGVLIDGQFAFSESPYRVLDDGEKTARGLPLESTAVAVGAELQVLTTPAEFEQLTQSLVAAESTENPFVAATASATEPTNATPPTAATTPWILGAKRILWVQVDFSDDPGAVATEAEIGVTNAQVSAFYAANSQGRTTMTFTVLPSVLRLPREKAVYNASSGTVGQLQTDAATLAKAYDAANGGAGTYDPDRYDRWIVLFKRVPAYTFGGQAQLTGPQIRMNGTISPTTTAHEIGHTQGLRHAHYWLPSGNVGAGAGAHVEYGDVFDNMGGGSATTGHFGAAQKDQLGYLDAANVTTVTEAGTYRLFRHDHADASGVRGLRIRPPGLDYDYWVDHRRQGPASFTTAQLDRLRNGVIIRWGQGRAPFFTSGPGTYLVDATPGSAGGANDAPLRIGESFVDPDAGLTIKPLAVGGTAPAEYIDVQISFGAIDGNRNPVLQASLPTGPIAPRTNVIFTATASDPDNDPVYFRWDFGDRQLNPNLNNITRRFTKGGSYSLRVSAHDGKGGVAARTLTFDIPDPLLSWTSRSSGGTTSVNDVIFGGGKFIAPTGGAIVTSDDGVTWGRVTNAALSPFTWISAAHGGSRYVVVGLRGTGTDRSGAAYSGDGTNWEVAAIAGSGTPQITDIAYGAGRFVAVGDQGRIFTTTDGANWTAVSSPVNTFLRAIAYADDLFVASGDQGRIIVSSDGVNWANRSVATTNSLGSLARYNGQWITSSATVEAFASPDGVVWTRLSTAGRTNTTSKLIATGGLLFGATANGSIAFTEDPRNWSTHQIDSTANTTFTSVAEGKGLLAVVGVRGLIYTTTAPTLGSAIIAAPTLRNEADSLKVAVGKKNVLAASGAGFTKLELYANGTKVGELNGSSGALEWTPRTIGNYSLIVRGVDASGASVVSAAIPAVAGLPDWTWANTTPIGTNLNGAVRVGNKWWVVGNAGSFITVDAAGNVAPVDFPTTQHLTSIAHANGRFIVTGPYFDAGAREEIGSVWTSTDGYSWTPLLTTVFDNFIVNFAAFGGDQWLIGTSGGLLQTSPDGLVWTRQVSGVTNSLRQAVYGNGQWVVVGSAGRIITSSNATAWTSRTSGTTNDLWSVAFQNGTFVAVGLNGTILFSDNGTNWTRATVNTTSHIIGVTAWNNQFVAVGNTSTVFTSPDGVNWSGVSLGGRFSDLFAVNGTGDEGVMVGRNGEIYTTTSGHSGWNRVTRGSGENRQAVIYAGGRFVAVGATTDPVTRTTISPISVSTGGVVWNRAPANAAFTNLSAITHAQQTYVAVGARYIGPDGVTNTADDSAVFTSTDASTWSPRATGAGVTQLNAVTASSSLFVTAGNGGSILTSPDATTWTPRTSGVTVALRAGAFGRGRFVVVGDSGTVLTSTDGTRWDPVSSGTTQALLTVGWWEEFGFIATGNAGTMISSADGITWQQVETGVSDNLTALANTPIGLVAAGGSNGTIIVSLDGASWSVATLPSDHIVRGLAASPSAIVAVGDVGNILAFELNDTRPAPVITAQPAAQTVAPGGTVALTVSAQNASGAVYQWFKDGTAIVGANTPTYLLSNINGSQLGTYTVSITSATGRVTSTPATLSFGAITDPGRLVNLSIRTDLTSATDSFTFGVVVGGGGTTGTKPLLVRAVGPSLAAFGVSGTLQDPKLEFFTGTTKVGENDNWGGVSTLRNTIAQVGAFPFSADNSRDAAIAFSNLASGANSAKISGTGSGTVLAELYDATPSTAFTAQTPRLVNVSVLKHIGSGVTAGFVIGGSSSRTVLIRAIGPTLSSFGVSDPVANPQLTLFRGTGQIGANDDWGGTPALAAAFGQVSAFPLTNASRDAALLVTLNPDNYTVQVSGIGGTGTALIEIYEVP